MARAKPIHTRALAHFYADQTLELAAGLGISGYDHHQVARVLREILERAVAVSESRLVGALRELHESYDLTWRITESDDEIRLAKIEAKKELLEDLLAALGASDG